MIRGYHGIIVEIKEIDHFNFCMEIYCGKNYKVIAEVLGVSYQSLLDD